MKEVACPVCGATMVSPLHNTPLLPISIMQATTNVAESLSVERRRSELFSCDLCRHVFNAVVEDLEYSGKGCRMYNNGALWQQHISDLQAYINKQRYDSVIEVGPGDGLFLQGIDVEKTTVFEPSDDVYKCEQLGYTTIKDYFDGMYVPCYGKTLVLMRHVLEHFQYPADMVERLTYTCRDREIEIIIEVPCISNAVQHFRLEDWTYEHAQHFTPQSLKRLFHRFGWSVVRCETKYNNEIIVLHAKLIPTTADLVLDKAFHNFARSHESNIRAARQRLARMSAEGKAIAYWGGLGKSALMLHQLCPDLENAQVFDSDPEKMGLCVPGAPCKIQYAAALETLGADVIVITTAWRAPDILREIKRRGIKCDMILVYLDGKLTELPNE